MIIQSLCRYYDILENDECVAIARPGYSQANISFALVISREGELKYIVDLRSSDKKPKPKKMDVPLQPSRANGIIPYFASDNAKYVFGVEKLKKDEFEKKIRKKSEEGNTQGTIVFSDDDKEVILISERSRRCFNSFRDLHHTVLDGLDDSAVKSFLSFLDSWNPELFQDHPKISEYMNDILDGGNFVFECEGGNLHKNSVVRQAWENHNSSPGECPEPPAQCLVTGNLEPISRLHQKIKGVYGAQVSGASLVSFNDDAFCSYGKDQSYNAPVGESSMFKYTTVLNHLLDRQNQYKLQIADTTTVFWAEVSDKTGEDLTLLLLNSFITEKESSEEPSGESKIVDKKNLQLIGDILKKVKHGQALEGLDLGGISPETNFYILGLSPNNARLAVRFWYQDHFGNFITQVAWHHLDMEIIGADYGSHYISVYRLLKETIPQSSDKNKVVSPLLGGLIMRAILYNTIYPAQMYSAILNRVKVERSINYVRAGFIKAYLLRSARSGSTKLKEDLITVSLNEESTDVPYRLGRLFAVLEKAQNETNKEMKSTINSKYFSSATTTPAVVFPVLLKLAQHHIAKSDWGYKSTQSIEDILSGVDEFPTYLNLEEQGMFMLGYYHQRKNFFKKKEVVKSEVA